MHFSSRFRLLLTCLAVALLARIASAQTAVNVDGIYQDVLLIGNNESPATSSFLWAQYLELRDGGSLTSRAAFEVYYVNIGTSFSLTIGNSNISTTAIVYETFDFLGDNNQLTVGTKAVLDVHECRVMGSNNTLTVTSGATSITVSQVRNDYFSLGAFGDGGNHLTVSGAYASWTSRDFRISTDSGGTGNTVTVQNGASLQADEGIIIASGVGTGGTLNIGGYDLTQATTGGTVTTASVVFNGGTADINFNQTNATSFSAAIGGPGTVTQRGSGTTTLSGSNSFTGATIIENGTLVAGSNTAFGGSTVSVHGGKLDAGGYTLGNTITLDGGTLAGTGTLTGAVTLGTGATLAPGNSPGTLTFTNGLTLNDGAVLDFQLGTTSDLILVTGGTLTGSASAGGITLNLADAGGFTAASYTLFDFSGATTSSFTASDFTLGSTLAGYTYQLAIVGSTLQLISTASAVPEPSTFAVLAGLSALGLVAYRRRRTR